MSQAADLLAAGQSFHAEQFPATIRIAGQSYAAATSGLRSGANLTDGGFTAERTLAFWLPAAAFTAAGQPLPHAQQPLECSAPAAFAGAYQIDTVLPDPTGRTITIRCTAPPQ